MGSQVPLRQLLGEILFLVLLLQTAAARVVVLPAVTVAVTVALEAALEMRLQVLRGVLETLQQLLHHKVIMVGHQVIQLHKQVLAVVAAHLLQEAMVLRHRQEAVEMEPHLLLLDHL